MKNKVYYCDEKGIFKKRIIEFPEQLEPDYVLVKYLFCGICGGDYSTYIGRRKLYPVSLGHEFVAQVVTLGKNVNSTLLNSFVISDFNFRCNECNYCISHKSHLCDQNDIQRFSNRAFAEYGIIHQNYLYKIDLKTNLPRACFMEPLSCVLHALNNFPFKMDEPILVYGLGSIGTMMTFYLSHILQHTSVHVFDINPFRLNKILNCFNVRKYSQCEPIPKYIIECTNTVAGLDTILKTANKNTHICIMSHLYGEDTSFVYEYICRKELCAYFPLRNGEQNNIYRAIAYIEKYWFDQMDSLYYIGNDLNEIFEKKSSNPFNKQIFNCP